MEISSLNLGLSENISLSKTRNLEQLSSKELSDEELKKACQSFESYFVQTIFKQMRNTNLSLNEKNSFFKKSSSENMFQDMLDQEISEKASTTSSFGLAKYLFENMK